MGNSWSNDVGTKIFSMPDDEYISEDTILVYDKINPVNPNFYLTWLSLFPLYMKSSTIPWFGERREDEGVGTSQSILEARQTHPLLLLKVKMHKMIWQHHMHLRCPKRLLQGRKATELPYVYSKLVYYPLCCVKNYDFKISVSWTMLFHELCLQIPGSGVQFLV